MQLGHINTHRPLSLTLSLSLSLSLHPFSQYIFLNFNTGSLFKMNYTYIIKPWIERVGIECRASALCCLLSVIAVTGLSHTHLPQNSSLYSTAGRVSIAMYVAALIPTKAKKPSVPHWLVKSTGNTHIHTHTHTPVHHHTLARTHNSSHSPAPQHVHTYCRYNVHRRLLEGLEAKWVRERGKTNTRSVAKP